MAEVEVSQPRLVRRAAVRTTLADLGSVQLASLAATSPHFRGDSFRIAEVFRTMLGTNAEAVVGGPPLYPSDVVDDHTPYEMSIAIGGAAPELRFLVETTDSDRSIAGRWASAREIGGYLREAHGVNLDRLDRIADLFEPSGPDHLLALWYACVVRPNEPLEAKAYVDLRSRGADRAVGVLEEALARLGLAAAYPRLLREAGRRGRDLDELVYFSVDLVGGPRARVKVYFRHHAATAEDIERVLGGLGGLAPGEIATFCTSLLGGEGPYLARPLVSCWSFTQPDARKPEPTGGTVYAPIAYYVRDDAEATARIHSWLDRVALPRDDYDRYLAAFARRPLDAGVGMHSYVSFKRDRGAARMTCYLAPEAHHVFAPGTLAARRFPSPRRERSPAQLVEHYETRLRIAEHPLFGKLAREPAAVAPLWAILANNWVGIGDQFPAWLSSLVARVEQPAIREILAKQLSDELGGGDPAQAHRLLFQRMLDDLAPFAPAPEHHERMLAPGRRLALELAAQYLERPVLEAVGGTLVMEVFGKQVDQKVGDLLRRQTQIDTATLTWLVIHETLEEAHADESLQLAKLVPPDAASQAAVARGAEALAALGFRYLDDLYEVLCEVLG